MTKWQIVLSLSSALEAKANTLYLISCGVVKTLHRAISESRDVDLHVSGTPQSLSRDQDTPRHAATHRCTASRGLLG